MCASVEHGEKVDTCWRRKGKRVKMESAQSYVQWNRENRRWIAVCGTEKNGKNNERMNGG